MIIVCSGPDCQTAAGCVCRLRYTPPFAPSEADQFYNAEIERLKERIVELECQVGEEKTRAMHAEARAGLARLKAFEEAANLARIKAAKIRTKGTIEAAVFSAAVLGIADAIEKLKEKT